MSRGFDAGSAVEALEYDFTTCAIDGKPCLGQGTIPEMTDKQLRDFGKATLRVMKKLGGDANATSPKTLFASLAPENLEVALDDMTAMVATFCQGHPSEDELKALPFRVRQAFFGWLFGELFSPKE